MNTEEIRTAFERWITRNPALAAKLLSKMAEEAPHWRVFAIIDLGHEIGLVGLPELEGKDVA